MLPSAGKLETTATISSQGGVSMAFFITPPGAFRPTKQWREFLEGLKTELP